MSDYTCRICGGALPFTTEPVVKCEYCGNLLPFTTADSEKKMTLFARANRLRRECEFDRAAAVYESIAADFPEESEASWGIVLCRYGIEYVDDPATGKKVPTCHRSSYASVLDDPDYQQTMDCADPLARKLYHREAAHIEELREGILAVSASEEPYDIFICYKETDEKKNRTLDSVLAQDIYDLLTNKGYRVFFSRISLEDKLGREYEPYIFAALNSAKVMLAVGTCFEHYDAVWVKNEWSRFLKLMEKDREKHLIPCYKDIDAYDMPREFRRLQSQDLGKLGAHQDLLRGIEKILPRAKATVPGDAAPLLKRAFLFLEDGDWSSADEYCEKVLDIDPACGEAYLGKLMAELEVNNQDALKNCTAPFDDSYNYKKAIRFGDSKLRDLLEGCTRYINERNEQERIACEKREEDARISRLKREKEALLRVLRAGIAHKKHEEQERIAQIEKLAAQREKLAVQREKLRRVQNLISAADYHTVALKIDGTVMAIGSHVYGQCRVSGWKEIVAISAGKEHTVGLKADGTVAATGSNYLGQCDVSEWRNIIAISAGKEHTVGLKKDGTVVATEYINRAEYDCNYGQCDVSEWKDVVAISAGENHTVGLKADGTVVATKYRSEATYNKDYGQRDVSEWTNIVAISAGSQDTFGLKDDGTVVSVGSHSWSHSWDVSEWSDIVAISAGENHTVGLKVDGTVVTAGYNFNGECDVSEWTDIVAVSAGWSHTVGLKADGTLVATAYTGDYYNGQCDVDGWRLFQSIDTIEEDKAVILKKQEDERALALKKQEEERALALKKQEEERALALKKQEEELERYRRRNTGLCQYCGGKFKGLFIKKCSSCGQEKDY